MSPALHTAQLALLNSQTRLPTAARLCVAAAVMVTVWDTRRRTRKTLAGLEPHHLKDVGISDIDARAETDKPFWQD